MAIDRVPRTCEQCGAEFFVRAERIQRTGAKFCSRSCASSHTRIHAPRNSPETRFWRNVRKAETCWPWTGRSHKDGYGLLKIDGRNAQAHRFSFELHHGLIPSGLCALHRCDNPPCVRAECTVLGCEHLRDSEGCESHIFLGTKKDNAVDMVLKERTKSPLSGVQVRAMRERYAAGGVTMTALGEEYGLHKSSVRDIVRRKRWTHIE